MPDDDTISSKEMTLRYIESLENRVKTLERREYIWIGKAVGLWVALVYLIFQTVGGG